MALVLHDGQVGCGRLLEIACAPGLLLESLASEQVVIVHVAKELKDAASIVSVVMEGVEQNKLSNDRINYKIEVTKAAGTETHTNVVQYCKERSAHHGIRRWALGVGNTMAGKAIALGSITKFILSQTDIMSQNEVWLLKHMGSTPKPHTPFTVVVLASLDGAGGKVKTLEQLPALQLALRRQRSTAGEKRLLRVVLVAACAPDANVQDDLRKLDIGLEAHFVEATTAAGGKSAPSAADASGAEERVPFATAIHIAGHIPTLNEAEAAVFIKTLLSTKMDLLVVPSTIAPAGSPSLQLLAAQPKVHVVVVPS